MEPSEHARPDWYLECFRTVTAQTVPSCGEASVQLLKKLPFDCLSAMFPGISVPRFGEALFFGELPVGDLGQVGLSNLGATCYVNAVVQALVRNLAVPCLACVGLSLRS